MTPCVPKTCVSFVVRSEGEEEEEEREGDERKRRVFVRTYVRARERRGNTAELASANSSRRVT